MRALLHIGMPKTGSTTIQQFLMVNRRALRRDGVLYRRYLRRAGQPEFLLAVDDTASQLVANPRIRGSLRVGTLDRQRRIAAAFEDRLARDIASTGCTRFIASSEYLGSYGRPREFIVALDEWMRYRFSEVRYVVYLRRQEDWVVSKYSQYVRGRGTRRLDEFVRDHRVPDLDSFVSRWESVVGPERLDVRLLDRSSLAGGDLLTDFCNAAGLDIGRLQRCRSSNERLGERQAAVMRGLNAHAGSRIRAETPRWLFTKVANRLISLVPYGSAGLALDPGSRDAIRAACAESNERLRARRFPHRDALFG